MGTRNLLVVCCVSCRQRVCAWSQPLHCRSLGRRVGRVQLHETQSMPQPRPPLGPTMLHTRMFLPTQTLRPPLCSHVCYLGFRSTKMTESPLKNILLMNRSRFTGRPPLAPRPRFGICNRA